jgi:hypothetical protein
MAMAFSCVKRSAAAKPLWIRTALMLSRLESYSAGFPPLYVAVESVTISSRFGGETAPTRGQPLAEPDGEDRPRPSLFTPWRIGGL